MSFQLSAAQITDYNKDGYLVVKNFLDANEISKLQQIAFDDGAMRKHAFDLNDRQGKKQNSHFGTSQVMMHTAY